MLQDVGGCLVFCKAVSRLCPGSFRRRISCALLRPLRRFRSQALADGIQKEILYLQLQSLVFRGIAVGQHMEPQDLWRDPRGRASSFLLRPFMAVKKTISASVMDRQIYHFFFMSSSSFLYDFAICNYCLLCYNLNELTPRREQAREEILRPAMEGSSGPSTMKGSSRSIWKN